jgi:hypothetical protein
MRAVDHCIVHIRHAVAYTVQYADYICDMRLHIRFGMKITYANMYSKKILQYLNRSFIFEEF